MSTAIANGSNEAERKAAKDANEVQDGVNLIAIVGGFPSTSHRNAGQWRLRRPPQQPPRLHRLHQQAERPLSADERP